MQNISPSSSKSDVILLDLGRDFTFCGLFLALLLPTLDLDLDALGASNWLELITVIFLPFTRNNCCWILVW